jgi:hypothetical protein
VSAAALVSLGAAEATIHYSYGGDYDFLIGEGNFNWMNLGWIGLNIALLLLLFVYSRNVRSSPAAAAPDTAGR